MNSDGPIVLSVRNLTKTYRSAGDEVAVLGFFLRVNHEFFRDLG